MADQENKISELTQSLSKKEQEFVAIKRANQNLLMERETLTKKNTSFEKKMDKYAQYVDELEQ